MYKVIKVEDDIVYVINLENNKSMKLNKSKIDWDVKVNDYIDFYFVDDKVIVTKLDKEDIIIQRTQQQQLSQNNTPTQNTEKIKKTSSAVWAGVLLGVFVGLLGLIGLLFYSDEDDRQEFIRGWTVPFYIRLFLEVLIIVFYLVVINNITKSINNLF